MSVAISLVADPKIVFLDEPSTGLDPENRRQLWDILSDLRGKRAMVLTTHSMEEADVLCTRIAIVNNGILRCVAPQVRLKSLYGGGYHLYINCQRQRFLKIQRQIEKRKIRKYRQTQQEEQKRAKDMEIRAHPSEHGSEIIDSTGTQDSERSDTIDEIYQRVINFVDRHIPSAQLQRQFNGNFIYLVPNKKGFDPSAIYT